jgi:hypothetical protein
MRSTAKLLRDIIAQEVVPDVPVFASTYPTEPVEMLVVTDTGGPAPVLQEENLRLSSAQLLTRTEVYETGWGRLNSLIPQIVSFQNYVDGDDRIVGIYLTTDILALGRDEQDRFLFSVNFNLMRDQSL